MALSSPVMQAFFYPLAIGVGIAALAVFALLVVIAITGGFRNKDADR